MAAPVHSREVTEVRTLSPRIWTKPSPLPKGPSLSLPVKVKLQIQKPRQKLLLAGTHRLRKRAS